MPSQLLQLHVLRTNEYVCILFIDLARWYILLTDIARVLAARLFCQEFVHFETVLFTEMRDSTLIQSHVHMLDLALHGLDGLRDLAIIDFLLVVTYNVNCIFLPVCATHHVIPDRQLFLHLHLGYILMSSGRAISSITFGKFLFSTRLATDVFFGAFESLQCSGVIDD